MIRAINSAGAGSSATLNSPMIVSVINNGDFSSIYNSWIRSPLDSLGLHYGEGICSGNAVYMGNSDPNNPSILSQRLITQIGVTYTCSFWLTIHYTPSGTQSSVFRCICDNITLLTLNNAQAASTYYSVTFTATSTSSLLTFSGTNLTAHNLSLIHI